VQSLRMGTMTRSHNGVSNRQRQRRRGHRASGRPDSAAGGPNTVGAEDAHAAALRLPLSFCSSVLLSPRCLPCLPCAVLCCAVASRLPSCRVPTTPSVARLAASAGGAQDRKESGRGGGSAVTPLLPFVLTTGEELGRHAFPGESSFGGHWWFGLASCTRSPIGSSCLICIQHLSSHCSTAPARSARLQPHSISRRAALCPRLFLLRLCRPSLESGQSFSRPTNQPAACRQTWLN